MDRRRRVDRPTCATQRTEAGGGVIAFKKFFFTVRVPRPMIDKFFKYIETGTVQ